MSALMTIYLYILIELFFYREQKPFWSTPGATVELSTGVSLTGNVFPIERTGRYRCSINSVLSGLFVQE